MTPLFETSQTDSDTSPRRLPLRGDGRSFLRQLSRTEARASAPDAGAVADLRCSLKLVSASRCGADVIILAIRGRCAALHMAVNDRGIDRKSKLLNSSHSCA